MAIKVDHIPDGNLMHKHPENVFLSAAQQVVGAWAAETFPDHTPQTIAFHIQEKALKLSMALAGVRPTPWQDDAGGLLVLLLTLCAHQQDSAARILQEEHRRNTAEGASWPLDATGIRHRATVPRRSEAWRLEANRGNPLCPVCDTWMSGDPEVYGTDLDRLACPVCGTTILRAAAHLVIPGYPYGDKDAQQELEASVGRVRRVAPAAEVPDPAAGRERHP